MKIALMSYARSGKDTIYSILNSYSESLGGGHIVRLAFGDALRVYAHAITGVPHDPKPRWLYEQFGKAMRDIDENVWVKQLDKEYRKALDAGLENFVITDLRQPNEYNWARRNGFKIVFVQCDESIRKARSQGDSNWMPVNPSETEIVKLQPDLFINNEGSFDELVRDIINWYWRIDRCTKES